MPDSLARYAPLTGVAGAVLFLVGIFTGSEPAKSTSSPAAVVHFYAIHRSEVETTSVLIGISLVLFLLFTASLRAYLRRSPGAEGPASIVLVGASVMFTAGLLATGLEYTLAHHLLSFTPSTVQAVNVVAQEVFVPILGGVFLIGFASFLAIIVRGAALPRWLGWLALLVAVVSAITPIGFAGFIVFIVWVVITSIFMYMRMDAAAGGGAPAAPGQAAA